MFEDLLTTTVKQIPSLALFAGALVMIVKMFMKMLSDVAERCHTVQDRSTAAIKESTEVLSELKTLVRAMNGSHR